MEWKQQRGWMKGRRKAREGNKNGKSNVITCRSLEMNEAIIWIKGRDSWENADGTFKVISVFW